MVPPDKNENTISHQECVFCSKKATVQTCILPAMVSVLLQANVSVILCQGSLSACSPGGSGGKEFACSAGDLGSIPGSGRSAGEGNDYPLQCSCLENPMDRGAWQAKSTGSQTVRHDWATNTSLQATEREAIKRRAYVLETLRITLLFSQVFYKKQQKISRV